MNDLTLKEIIDGYTGYVQSESTFGEDVRDDCLSALTAHDAEVLKAACRRVTAMGEDGRLYGQAIVRKDHVRRAVLGLDDATLHWEAAIRADEREKERAAAGNRVTWLHHTSADHACSSAEEHDALERAAAAARRDGTDD